MRCDVPARALTPAARAHRPLPVGVASTCASYLHLPGARAALLPLISAPLLAKCLATDRADGSPRPPLDTRGLCMCCVLLYCLLEHPDCERELVLELLVRGTRRGGAR